MSTGRYTTTIIGIEVTKSIIFNEIDIEVQSKVQGEPAFNIDGSPIMHTETIEKFFYNNLPFGDRWEFAESLPKYLDLYDDGDGRWFIGLCLINTPYSETSSESIIRIQHLIRKAEKLIKTLFKQKPRIFQFIKEV